MPVIISNVNLIPLDWRNRFVASLKHSAYGRRAFFKLASVLGDVTLFSYMYIYTKPVDQTGVKAEKAQSRKTAKALKATSADLDKLQKSTAALLAYGGDSLRRELGDEQLNVVSKSLEAYREHLLNIEREYRRRASEKGKHRNELNLVLVWMLMKHRTGSPHWGDLASVLEAAYAAHGQNEHVDNFAVRQIIRRFEKTYPERFRSYQEAVSKGGFSNVIYSDEWKKSPPQPPVTEKKPTQKKGKAIRYAAVHLPRTSTPL